MTKRITVIIVSCLTIGFIFSSCFRKAVKNQPDTLVVESDSSAKNKDSKKVDPQEIEEEYFKKDFIRYENYIYNENIKTILLHRDGAELTPPVIRLNSNEKLKLRFDDLDARPKEYYYTVIHCNADWKPSDLEQYEYIENFTEGEIYDYLESFNTVEDYFNYTVTFPNTDISITKSGNYVLKVYLKNQEDQPAFTRRFMVFEPTLNVEINLKRATLIEYRNYKQEVDFTIRSGSEKIYNPYQNLKVVLMQNGRWDNAIFSLKPKFVKDNAFIYDYEEENLFDGGNEFRNFDIKSVKYQTMRIRQIDDKMQQYHAYVQDDERRPFQRYTTQTDINGKKLIKNEDVKDSDTESEYVNVYFNLPYQTVLADGSLYVFGAITDWQFKDEAKLKYDYTTNSYRAKLYLKQGYYDYAYVFLENNATTGDISFVEGNHWETENDYMILVYYREPGTLYDKLAGVQYANTVTK